MNPSTASERIDELLADPAIAPSIVHIEREEPRDAKWAELPGDVDPRLREALARRGVEGLYSHQREAWDRVRRGENIVVVTPTASGKTLCYNLPVAETLLRDPEARALYLFPTKALSQDQQAELNELTLSGDLGLKVFTYDGDTPDSLRVAARDTGRIVISNPDMFHTGILPNHPKWIRFFTGLRYVVVDEMHAYRGVFGSHVANVLRRLKRVAAFYGARPQFILSSATIGNPVELASKLIDEEVSAVTDNGAPRGGRVLVFYNPPLVDPVQGIRKSTATESEKLALILLRKGIKTILFARSRLRVELIASYINESLENPFNDNEGITVKPYRAGLLPSERRAIEKGLREGSIQGVVSTNALELGIDIGGLDAAVVAGFPGSFASFWQQAGRAGRRGGLSVAFLVASSAPLDQFIIGHPEYFFGRAPETGRIDPSNPYIFMDHMRCSAYELPYEEAKVEDDQRDALAWLEEDGIVRKSGGRWYWSADAYPSEGVSLRSASSDNVVIIDRTGGGARAIGEMDRPGAKELVYDDAVYIHLGRQYIVEKLDLENRSCFVVERELDYWTDSIVKTDLSVLSEDEEGSCPGEGLASCRFVLGDVLVRSQAEKFKKLRFHSHENIGYGEIHLPPEEMQTRALALVFDEESGGGRFLAALGESRKAAVLAAAGRLIHDIAPVYLMCDPRDLGLSERVRDPHYDRPTIFLFDRYPGGTGLAEGLVERLPELFAAAAGRLGSCGCADGCPSCIGVDFLDGGQGRPLLRGRELKPLLRDFLLLLSGAAAKGAADGTAIRPGY
ncbi:MAG TPA: DEAD/DEAH box helicase [Rectinemataceae bacterium]|nr:DEAD/DEAH box helicase [Rectinemataceae bacterium]